MKTTSKSTAQELLTLPQVSKHYGLSPTYLRAVAQNGRLKAFKIGQSWVTTHADVKAFIASRQRRGLYRSDLH